MSTQSPRPSSETGITPGAAMPIPHQTSRPDADPIESHQPENWESQIKKPDPSSDLEDRASNLGCGLALIIVGAGMLAQRFGWIPAGDWIWPAGLIGLGATYLYKAFRQR
jgi:hypothetical protein